MTIELFPHQEKAVEEMHNGCVLAGDVGVGKTITALSYALLKEPGRDIYVITTAKKRDSFDWQTEAAKLGVRVDGIVVDSWNNIKNYRSQYGAFFIFDEQRLVGTGAWVKSFYDIARKNHWVLLSATPGDNWLDYVPVFIANGFYKNVTEFRQEHVIYSRFSKYPKVDRYINTHRLLRYRGRVIVEMPLKRHTTRHLHMVECDYDTEIFGRVWKRRWHVYEERPLKDAGELFRVGRKVVASDASRLAAVAELLQTHPKLIVFYNFDYELEMLRTLADGPVERSGTEPSTLTSSYPSPKNNTSSLPRVIPTDSASWKSTPGQSLSSRSCTSQPTSATGFTTESRSIGSPNGFSMAEESTVSRSSTSSSRTPHLMQTGSSDRSCTSPSDQKKDGPQSRRPSTTSYNLQSPTTDATSRDVTGSVRTADSDPLMGTIWEKGFDEEKAWTQSQRLSSLEKSSRDSSATRSSTLSGTGSPTEGTTHSTGNETGTRESRESEGCERERLVSDRSIRFDQEEECPQWTTKETSSNESETTGSQSDISTRAEWNGTSTQTSPCIPETSSSTSKTVDSSMSADVTLGPKNVSDVKRWDATSTETFAIAEWNGHKHEKVPNTDRWLYLVQYMAGSEGWNCTTTDAMVFFSLTYSYKQFYQSQGRIDRVNTPYTDLHYYALMSKSIVDRAVWRALRQKKDFNVRGVKL